jgi:hypothetical protein
MRLVILFSGIALITASAAQAQQTGGVSPTRVISTIGAGVGSSSVGAISARGKKTPPPKPSCLPSCIFLKLKLTETG